MAATARRRNPDGDFELAARVFFEPWKGGDGALSGLGFGLAATHGDKTGTGNDFLPRYRTPGQLTFFSYRSDVAADGTHDRWSPQMYWYAGRFGVLGEYIASRQDVARNGVERRDRQPRLATQHAASPSPANPRATRASRDPTIPSPSAKAAGAHSNSPRATANSTSTTRRSRSSPIPASAADGARSWGVGFNWYLNAALQARRRLPAYDVRRRTRRHRTRSRRHPVHPRAVLLLRPPVMTKTFLATLALVLLAGVASAKIHAAQRFLRPHARTLRRGEHRLRRAVEKGDRRRPSNCAPRTAVPASRRAR